MSSPVARAGAVSRRGRMLRFENLEDRRLLSVAPSHGDYLITAGNAGAAQPAPRAAIAAAARFGPDQIPTTTTLTSSTTQGYVGETITLTARVKGSGASPAGDGVVQFTIDNMPYGPAVKLGATAEASISLNTLTAGVHVVTAAFAAYQGGAGAGFAPSESVPPLDITIAALAAPGAPGTASLVPDLIVAGESSIIITGSSGGGTIAVYPGGTNQIVVKILGSNHASYTFDTAQIAHLVLYGLTGNNGMWIEPGVKIPAILVGGDGNNTLMGGSGPTVLVGGSGQNTLRAGTGPTVMIAGAGVASLFGGTGYDLVIGGTTDYDTSMSEPWSTSSPNGETSPRVFIPA